MKMNSGFFVLKHVSLALAALNLQDLECPCPNQQGFQGRAGWQCWVCPCFAYNRHGEKSLRKNSNSCCHLCKAADFSGVRQIWNIKEAFPELADLLLHILLLIPSRLSLPCFCYCVLDLWQPPPALNMLHDGREVAFTMTALLQVALGGWQLSLSEFFWGCVTGSASKHVSPPPCFNPILSYRWASVQQTQKARLAPGELCIAVDVRVGCTYMCGKLHPKATEDNFHWFSVSFEQSCWNWGECWWKQMRGASGGTCCW